MVLAYFLNHAPWLLALIAGFWIISLIWKGIRQRIQDKRRRDWNNLSKPSSAKHHARSLPHKGGHHDWY